MKVYQRRMPNGKLSPTYYIDVVVRGKRIFKSTGKSTEAEAKRWARDYVDKLKGCESAREVAVKFRHVLAGALPVLLADAFVRFADMPTSNRRKRWTDTRRKQMASIWDDWKAWLEADHSAVKYVHEVTPVMAQAYITRLRTSGRFQEASYYKREGRRKVVRSPLKDRILSHRTLNVHHDLLRSVFDGMGEAAGVFENPFAGVPRLANDYATRAAFTAEELKSIGEKATGLVRDIFIVGLYTGLRRSDFCRLQWPPRKKDTDMVADLSAGVIDGVMRKTGQYVRVPILPPLAAHLASCEQASGAFIFPELADMLEHNPDGISYRVRTFLDDIKIVGQVTIGDRTRQTSQKDIHSLRHTFCYLAAIHGVPLPVVQSIVGHVDEAMTRHYAAHANDQVRAETLAKVPDHLGVLQPGTPPVDRLAEARILLDQVKGNKRLIEQIRKLLI